MGFREKLLNLCAKPKGFFGRRILRRMNVSHAELADWGMSHLRAERPKEILDIGCGGGRHLYALLTKYPEANGTGIDYMPLAVEMTKRFNREFIKAGRCAAQQGDVSRLTLPSEKFDLVTAFETVYFWPDLIHCFKQVARVVKPEGVFLIVHETDGLDPKGRKFEKIIDSMTVYTAGELENALRAAGFSETSAAHHPKNPWIAVSARKPS